MTTLSILQVILLGSVLILWVAGVMRLYRLRLLLSPPSYGRILATAAVLILVTGLLLPWSAYPTDLGKTQNLTEHLDEIDSVVLLMLITVVAWVVYRKRGARGRAFSILVFFCGLILLVLVWAAFTFDEQKLSLISANEAYISTLIQPRIGYFLSIFGSIVLIISGLLRNPSHDKPMRDED